jgi:hypothetical protein
VSLLFPKTLVLFRELPQDQFRTFRRDDRFTHLSQSNGDVTIEIMHLPPGTSITTDPSARSIQKRQQIGHVFQGYEPCHKQVRVAEAKDRLDWVQFPMGLILANLRFFNMLWPVLHDRTFAFQCSAESIKGILNKQNSLNLEVRGRLLYLCHKMKNIMIEYRFTKSPGRFVIGDSEWRELNNFFRHEYQHIAQLHLVISAEFWDKARTHDHKEILAQSDLSVGREINILQHIAKMAGRKTRHDDWYDSGTGLHLTIEGTNRKEGRLLAAVGLWKAMRDLMDSRPLQSRGRGSLASY